MATGAQVSFGSGADAGTFNGTVGAASIYGGAGADTLDFNGAVELQRLIPEPEPTASTSLLRLARHRLMRVWELTR